MDYKYIKRSYLICSNIEIPAFEFFSTILKGSKRYLFYNKFMLVNYWYSLEEALIGYFNSATQELGEIFPEYPSRESSP